MSNAAFKIKEPAVTELSIDDLLDEIKAEQGRKSVLEARIRELKAPVKAYMKDNGVRALENHNGVRAALFTTDRSNADKAAAQGLVEAGRLSAEDFATIFPVKRCENFKVK